METIYFIRHSMTGVNIENYKDFKSLSELYSLPHIYQICSRLSSHQKQWQNSSYSKNDFFDLIRCMVKEP